MGQLVQKANQVPQVDFMSWRKLITNFLEGLKSLIMLINSRENDKVSVMGENNINKFNVVYSLCSLNPIFIQTMSQQRFR